MEHKRRLTGNADWRCCLLLWPCRRTVFTLVVAILIVMDGALLGVAQTGIIDAHDHSVMRSEVDDPQWAGLIGSMRKMHDEMSVIERTRNADTDFVRLMLPHHQAAVATLAACHPISLLTGAPTGRAAQRLIELTGLPAMTLHRLLDFDPHTQRFQRNAECPLHAALVLVDEVSMVDLFLFDALLAALPLGAHLVLLGDADQLPSVGPGHVLADLIAADVVPVLRFTQLYRRAATSSITASAHAVRAGMLPILTDDPQAECRLIEAQDPQQAIARIVALVTDELPAARGCDPLTDIQVLCPLNQGEAGTVVLNQALQQRLNAAGRRIPEAERALHIGDRVLITQNNYRLGVCNGEAGMVVRASTRPLQVVVRTAQGEVAFIGKEVEQLTLGYAVSVHKAQGGEFPGVVIFLHDLHAPLLQRTVLYTAMTRAQQRCVIVGTQTALRQAVETHHAVQRYTGFAAALQRALPTRHVS